MRLNLTLLHQEGGDVASGCGGGGWVTAIPLHLSGDEHQPLIQGVPQQLQRLQEREGRVRERVGEAVA